MPTSPTDLRRLILDTARRLLVQHGYAGLTMRKLAKAIGYSPTSIYLHFENKDALSHALIDEGMERLYRLLSEVEQRVGAPIERLRELCWTYVRFGRSNPEYYEIMFQLHPDQMARYPAANYRRARRNLDVFARALTDGIEEGVVRDVDPRVTASTVWALLHGAVSLLNAHRVDVRIDVDAFIEATIAQAVSCYAAHGTRRDVLYNLAA